MARKPRSVTELRFKIHEDLNSPGITPITVNGKLSGILISNEDLDSATSARLLNQITFNPRAAANEILDHSIK